MSGAKSKSGRPTAQAIDKVKAMKLIELKFSDPQVPTTEVAELVGAELNVDLAVSFVEATYKGLGIEPFRKRPPTTMKHISIYTDADIRTLAECIVHSNIRLPEGLKAAVIDMAARV